MTTPGHPGDLIVVRINAPVLGSDVRSFLSRVRPLGIHFGADAFEHTADYAQWTATFRKLCEDIQSATGRARMLWAIDHEGGRVVRTPAPITRFPYPLNWKDRSGEIGKAFGKELASLGINVLFGPSLDVMSQGEHSVIGPRALGVTADDVDKRALPFTEALEAEGVVPTFKHFPGHGVTVEDSHFQLPNVNLDRNTLMDRDVQPFARAIDRGAQSIMLAHIVFNQLDAHYPSSLSTHFHLDLLRGELGYEGVSMTDDLDMLAIAKHFAPAEIAARAVECENNFMIFNHSLTRAQQVFDELPGILARLPQKAERIFNRTHTLIDALADTDVGMLDMSLAQAHQHLSEQVGESFAVDIEDFDGD